MNQETQRTRDLWRLLVGKHHSHDHQSDRAEPGPSRAEKNTLAVTRSSPDASRPRTAITPGTHQDLDHLRLLLRERFPGKDGGLKGAVLQAVESSLAAGHPFTRYLWEHESLLSSYRADGQSYENTWESEESWVFAFDEEVFTLTLERWRQEHD